MFFPNCSPSPTQLRELGWWILEQKFLYYVLVAEIPAIEKYMVDDYTFDIACKEYERLCKETNQEPISNLPGFPSDRPAAKLVDSSIRYRCMELGLIKGGIPKYLKKCPCGCKGKK